MDQPTLHVHCCPSIAWSFFYITNHHSIEQHSSAPNMACPWNLYSRGPFYYTFFLNEANYRSKQAAHRIVQSPRETPIPLLTRNTGQLSEQLELRLVEGQRLALELGDDLKFYWMNFSDIESQPSHPYFILHQDNKSSAHNRSPFSINASLEPQWYSPPILTFLVISFNGSNSTGSLHFASSSVYIFVCIFHSNWWASSWEWPANQMRRSET